MKYIKTYNESLSRSYYKKDPNRMDKLIHIVDSLQDVFDEYDIQELKGTSEDAAEGEIFYYYDNDFTQDTSIAVSIPIKGASAHKPGGYLDVYIERIFKEVSQACEIASKRTGYKIGITSENHFGYHIIFIYPMWKTNEKVFESISENDMKDAIGDILTELQDNGFSITSFRDDEYGEDDYKIHIGTKENKHFYKWKEVKHAVEHIMNFAKDNGYFCSVRYYKPLRKPAPGKEPRVDEVILRWAKKYTFTSSMSDTRPSDDDYVCVANDRGIVRGLDIIISLLGQR